MSAAQQLVTVLIASSRNSSRNSHHLHAVGEGVERVGGTDHRRLRLLLSLWRLTHQYLQHRRHLRRLWRHRRCPRMLLMLVLHEPAVQ